MSITVAIIGNPNCGKTTLFNKLTGSRQKVGNWPGVTVDKKQGQCTHRNQILNIVDLPGTYSLTVASEGSLDERIACDYILSQSADVFINIIDGANLKRNLYLTTQLLEMNVPCIIAVNMLDIAKKRGINIDLAALSQELGCPVLPLVSSKNEGVIALKDRLIQSLPPTTIWQTHFNPAVEQAIEQLIQAMQHEKIPFPSSLNRWAATRLLEDDAWVQQIVQHTHLPKLAVEFCAKIRLKTQEDSDILIADGRYQKVQQLAQRVMKKTGHVRQTLTAAIDRVVMHRWLGIPIFLLLMYLMFEFSMNIGTLLQPFFDISSTTLFINGVAYLGHELGLPVWLTAIFSHGIGLGINTVVNFIPQIGLMFVFLSLLEDTGYMARAAFVMDRLMQFAGLPGKSFVPLIVGFGCNVPSIMATRSLDSKRDRIMTCLMAPFMSCGARLAIFIVFASAFFPHHGGLMVFLLYIIGIIIALITGLLLKTSILRGESAPFVLEMPVYHVPTARNILMLTWSRLKGFLIRAGKIIIPICVLVGSLNAITPTGKVYPYGSQQSLLSNVGRVITPVLKPMGVTVQNWPATVGLITGTLAKEVVVGTLNTLYTQQSQKQPNYKHFNLWSGLASAFTTTFDGFRQVFTTTMINPFTANEASHDMNRSAMGHMAAAFASGAAAFAYLLFVLLYIPCVSTIGVLAREIGRGWAWFSTLWSFNVAYCAAVIFYQCSIFMAQPIIASSWIIGLLLLQALFFIALKYHDAFNFGLKNNEVSV